MKHSKFVVVFSNHTFQSVRAFNKKESIILAQAEQIKKGLGYTVQFVKDENGNII